MDSHPFRYMGENTYLQKLCVGFSSVKLSFVKSPVFAPPPCISKRCGKVDLRVYGYLVTTMTWRRIYMYVVGQIVNRKK